MQVLTLVWETFVCAGVIDKLTQYFSRSHLPPSYRESSMEITIYRVHESDLETRRPDIRL